MKLEGSAFLTFVVAQRLRHFASCLSVSSDFPIVLRIYAEFPWRKLANFHETKESVLA